LRRALALLLAKMTRSPSALPGTVAGAILFLMTNILVLKGGAVVGRPSVSRPYSRATITVEGLGGLAYGAPRVPRRL